MAAAARQLREGVGAAELEGVAMVLVGVRVRLLETMGLKVERHRPCAVYTAQYKRAAHGLGQRRARREQMPSPQVRSASGAWSAGCGQGHGARREMSKSDSYKSSSLPPADTSKRHASSPQEKKFL